MKIQIIKRKDERRRRKEKYTQNWKIRNSTQKRKIKSEFK